MPRSSGPRSAGAPRPRPASSAGSDPNPLLRAGVRPRWLWVVVVAVWAEALAAAAAAVGLVVVVVRGTQLVAASVALAVLSAGLGVVLALAGRALLRRRRWARSPVITLHVLVVAMSVASWRTAPPPWAAVGAALGVVVVAGLLAPSVVAWTQGGRSAATGAAQERDRDG